MPEGHSIRHLANLSDAAFKGKKITATSPQGRFAADAAVIDQKQLTGAGAHGKHLFLKFDDEHAVHIHLGLYGWLHFNNGTKAKPKDSVRLRLEVDDFYADLIAPTLETDQHVTLDPTIPWLPYPRCLLLLSWQGASPLSSPPASACTAMRLSRFTNAAPLPLFVLPCFAHVRYLRAVPCCGVCVLCAGCWLAGGCVHLGEGEPSASAFVIFTQGRLRPVCLGP